jgi:NADH-quinone oxidoreductase subunit H
MIGELSAVLLMTALITILFFGGWLSPVSFLPDGFFWMLSKMLLFFFVFSLIKGLVPRYRYDQLMRLGWKVMLPVSLAWVVFVSFMAHFKILSYARW